MKKILLPLFLALIPLLIVSSHQLRADESSSGDRIKTEKQRLVPAVRTPGSATRSHNGSTAEALSGTEQPIPVARATRAVEPEDTGAGAQAATSAFLPNTMDGLNDKRLLVNGDRLSFKVVEDEGLPRSLTVTDSSEIDVPYIGRVSVANKTCKQFAFHVKRLLEKEYYYQATVIVGLDAAGNSARAASRGTVYVMGQVRREGPMDLPANEVFTVTKAILRAGGFGPYANKRKVKLVRGTNSGGAAKPIIIDCVEIMDKGQWDKDIEVNPEDIITVPEKWINIF
jgi:polysaccharide biosynthesis/export protein